MAKLLFSRMRSDINRFVDKVYAPYQINNAMACQQELATSSDPKERSKSLLLAINAAFSDRGSPQLQEAVLKGMGIFVFKIRQDVESMRTVLLNPINQQETEVLSSIERAYLQLHYANSIITGHLSSVVKVHDTQSENMDAMGMEQDLRTTIGTALSGTTEKIADLVEESTQADEKLSKVEENAEKLKNTINEFKSKVSGN
ncbi:MAG: hypothetical protein L0Z73_18990 [Gammaproteobacteria bacterium]|nr:hypothetical protein [Gammaproteobacteria bacterium]